MNYQSIYEEIAFKLDGYYDKRIEFDELCNKFYIGELSEWKERLLNRNPSGKIYDPLTLLCVINGFKGKKRVKYINGLCSLLEINKRLDENEQFLGVSIIDHNHRTIPVNAKRNYNECVDQCWEILHAATIYVNDDTDIKNKNSLISSFNNFNKIESRSWDKITHALSYCYPNVFIALSTPNRSILKNNDYLDKEIYNKIKNIKLSRISGDDYLLLTDAIKNNKCYSVSELSRIGYELKLYIDNITDAGQMPNQQNRNVGACGVQLLKESTIKRFTRDAKIRAFVFERDNYTCRCCGRNQTFNTREGKQYMESHHLIPLYAYFKFEEKGLGIDNVKNVICVCPECHRAFHFGDKDTVIKKIDQVFSTMHEIEFKKHFKITKKGLIKIYSSHLRR